MADNTLKIDGESFELSLEGDAEYIEASYEALRPVLTAQFKERFKETDESSSSSNRRKSTQRRRSNVPETTDPLFRLDAVEQQVAAGKELAEIRLQLVVCTDMYRRVAALGRDDFRSSIFGQVFEADALNAVIVNQDSADSLKQHIEFGETLWRELTEAGKKAVHGDSS